MDIASVIMYISPILGLTTIAIMLIVFGWKSHKYLKKIEFLTHIVDKGYEYQNIDLNKV